MYLALKVIHIISATLFFGAGLASAFLKWRADREGDLKLMVFAHRHIVLADWCFTVPSGIVLPLTGYLMIREAGYPPTTPWLVAGMILFLIAGITWLPAAFLQIKMRDAAIKALDQGQNLPPQFQRWNRIWLLLGIPAFLASMAAFYVMVFKTVPFP